MPPPLGVIPSDVNPIYQITEAHGVGDIGWSETYFMQITGGTATPVAVIARHALIIEARRIPIPPVHIIETVRVSNVEVPGDSTVRFPPDAALGVGNGPPGDADPVLGYFMATTDISGLVNHTRIYRGWQPDNLAFTPGSPRTTIPPGPVRVMMLTIGTELITTRTFTGITTRYMMKSFQRPESVGGPTLTPAGTVQVEADGKLAFTWPTTAVGAVLPGTRFHVRAPRVRCVRGVSGIHQATGTVVIGDLTKILTSTTYDCPAAALTLVVPKAFLHIDSYYPITRAIDGGAGKKDAGRPFYLRRGRRSVRR